MSADITARFQSEVVGHLEPLSSQLVPVLRLLIAYPFVPHVHHLAFEVFCDGFTEGFPVRTFFIDARNCEYFVYVDGKAQYPCDVPPDLLSIDRVYSREFEREFAAQSPDLDYFILAGSALIPWFSRCWNEAGGAGFGRGAFIGLHDDARAFDLTRQEWTR